MADDDLRAQVHAVLNDRYTIDRELGRGGMATVYLAEDVRHKRRVAIKVLHPELSAVIGSERFLKEIELTASLQHPHILPLFDSGSANGQLFYVMPFVDGETLRTRIDREGPLPVADALRIAREAADALQYAHERKVVHRDVKPENILLQGGHALVADFGIALAVQHAGGQRITQTGISLGTPQYMAPEQGTGDTHVDARADIYALGAVTYEMLVGEPPFAGPNSQAVIARLLTTPPPLVSATRGTVSASIDQAINTALAKLPADRFSSAREFAEALGGAGGVTVSVPRPTSPAAVVWRHPLPLALAAMLIAVSAVAVRLWMATRTPSDEKVVRFPIDMVRYVSTGAAVGPGIAISPDGRTIAYIGGSGDAASQQVMVRSLDDPRPHAIPGTDLAQGLFFSPDGKSLCIWSKGRLIRVPLDGSSPVVLSQGIGYTGGAWGPKGVIALSVRGRLMTISDSGGTMSPVPGDSSAGFDSFPVFIDDGETVIVVSGRGGQVQGGPITAVSLSSGRRTPLGVVGNLVVGVIDDVLLYTNGARQLMALRLDKRSLTAVGAPIPVLTIPPYVGANQPSVAASQSGTLVVAGGSSAAQLVGVGMNGVATTVAAEARSYATPRFSPDGRRIVMAIGDGNISDLWLLDAVDQTFLRITQDTSGRPEWTTDGKHILYRHSRPATKGTETQSEIFSRPLDGSSPPVPVFADGQHDYWEAVMTPDGKGLVLQRDVARLNTGSDVVYRAFGDTIERPVAATAGDETQGRPSPDGRWVAFQFTAPGGGTSQVVVRSITGSGAPVVVSPTFGSEPVWSRDGKHLYYRDGRQFVEATYETTPAFRVLSRRPLFADVYDFASAPHANYDLYPDGTGFLVVKAIEGRQLVVTVNWRQELRRAMRRQGER